MFLKMRKRSMRLLERSLRVIMNWKTMTPLDKHIDSRDDRSYSSSTVKLGTIYNDKTQSSPPKSHRKIWLPERSEHLEKKTQRKSFHRGIDLSRVLRKNISLSESLGLCLLVIAPNGIGRVFTLPSSGRRIARGIGNVTTC